MSVVVGKKTQDFRQRYTDPETYRAFAVGFVAGQAEKVYLGCCQAAMFRPSKEHFEWLRSEAEVVASSFGLQVVVLDSHCPDTPYEVWVCRDAKSVGGWLNFKPNSQSWHFLRAAACGIPLADVDDKYHLRDGYGEKCD